MKTEEEIYLEFHEQAEPIIKRHADQCAIDDGIRTAWHDQHIEVQYMIIAAMIEFAKLYANQKLDEAAEIPPMDELDYEDQYDYSKGVTRVDTDYKQSILNLKDLT